MPAGTSLVKSNQGYNKPSTCSLKEQVDGYLVIYIMWFFNSLKKADFLMNLAI